MTHDVKALSQIHGVCVYSFWLSGTPDMLGMNPHLAYELSLSEGEGLGAISFTYY